MKKKVVIIDDSMYMRTVINDALTADGNFEVVGMASDGNSGIEMVLELQPDLVTLDNVLPDMIGIDILKILKQEEKINAHIFMVSAVGQDVVVKEGLDLGAAAYIVKPFTPESLVETIKQHV
jgi:two-component system, chemotaxis family, chemotaxis protein CheY